MSPRFRSAGKAELVETIRVCKEEMARLGELVSRLHIESDNRLQELQACQKEKGRLERAAEDYKNTTQVVRGEAAQLRMVLKNVWKELTNQPWRSHIEAAPLGKILIDSKQLWSGE